MECNQTFSGEHSYSVRNWLAGGADPNIKDHWSKVIACVCGKRPDDEEAILTKLAEGDAERRRQQKLSRELLAERQPKLL